MPMDFGFRGLADTTLLTRARGTRARERVNNKKGLGKPGTKWAAWSDAPRGLAVLALLLSLLPLPAAADSDPSNDSDSLTLSLSPVVDLGVEIDTATARLF